MHVTEVNVSTIASAIVCLRQSLALLQVMCKNICEFGQREQPRESATDYSMCQVSDPPSVGATDVLKPNVIELISDDEVSSKTA